MLKIKKLSNISYKSCFNIVSESNNYFIDLGWSINQFENQLLNKNNLGLGLFEEDSMCGFILGQIITIEKILEYEILLIYVKKDKRKLGYASKLLNEIPIILQKKDLKKIYLEVASSNLTAINLYKKNKYKQKGSREKYYLINDEKIDALFFEKII